ncbi:MAG: gluconate 2-dehydrogenase subunit 3 family protein, partial [Chloroflexota bacterium]|nr:gluconate 2-dehydrogenase subunit 3 family protein [Chloroflexota bacterium]
MTQQQQAKKRLEMSPEPPEVPPLRVPKGGGALNTPYPDYDVANEEKWAYDWDEKTRRLVMERVHNVPPYRFFSEEEVKLLEALCDRALPQPDRSAEEKLPIAPWIDERLHKGKGDGYRYGDMPGDRIAYRQALKGFDQAARELFQKPFLDLDEYQQEEVLDKVSQGQAPGEVWQQLPGQRFFRLFMNDVITNYYAHPAAWSEIGFNGPASPRG